MSQNKDKKEIFARLKKLKARAECEGSTPGEAASARKIMQALMEEFAISEDDLLAIDAHEARAKASEAKKPPAWEAMLGNRIASIFGCTVLRSSKSDLTGLRYQTVRHWVFVGVDAAPEVAQYAFEVLGRMCKKARLAYVRKHCKRLKTSTRNARADLYCEGWVTEATKQLTAWTVRPDQARYIEAYMAANYPALTDLKTNDRNADRNLREGDMNAHAKGRADGRTATINRGVGTAGNAPKRLGGMPT